MRSPSNCMAFCVVRPAINSGSARTINAYLCRRMGGRISLDEIRGPVLRELEAFDAHFAQAMRSKVPLLDKVTRYLVRTRGKQFRPLLALLSARVFGEVNEKSYSAATLVELLHTATLVHDDVVDDSFQRRGFFSIKALWKNKIAVLVGDYLLSRGLLTALERKHFDLLEILSGAVSEMSEGELLQLEKARRLDITLDVYFDIIRMKTASLIRSACVCGAKSTTDDPQQLATIGAFGEKIGMAFQIKDDLMDLSDDATGKPKIADIKEKKMTLPLILALSAAPASERKRTISLIRSRNLDPEAISAVLDCIRKYEGVSGARRYMEEYREHALAELQKLPSGDACHALGKLAHFVTERTH